MIFQRLEQNTDAIENVVRTRLDGSSDSISVSTEFERLRVDTSRWGKRYVEIEHSAVGFLAWTFDAANWNTCNDCKDEAAIAAVLNHVVYNADNKNSLVTVEDSAVRSAVGYLISRGYRRIKEPTTH